MEFCKFVSVLINEPDNVIFPIDQCFAAHKYLAIKKLQNPLKYLSWLLSYQSPHKGYTGSQGAT